MLVSQHVARADRGRAVAVIEIAWGLSSLVGVPLFGLLMSAGWSLPWLGYAAFGVASCVLLHCCPPSAAAAAGEEKEKEEGQQLDEQPEQPEREQLQLQEQEQDAVALDADAGTTESVAETPSAAAGAYPSSRAQIFSDASSGC